MIEASLISLMLKIIFLNISEVIFVSKFLTKRGFLADLTNNGQNSKRGFDKSVPTSL